MHVFELCDCYIGMYDNDGPQRYCCVFQHLEQRTVICSVDTRLNKNRAIDPESDELSKVIVLSAVGWRVDTLLYKWKSTGRAKNVSMAVCTAGRKLPAGQP